MIVFPDFKVTWAMPNKYTFQIPQCYNFISKHIMIQSENFGKHPIIIDPFCGTSKIANIRNDMRESGVDSLVWLKRLDPHVFDVVLFDPPYTPRQLKECYDDIGMALHDTTAGYWGKLKDEIVRITAPEGIILSFGYGASQVGMKRGFKIYDGLVILHGGNHNATICMAEHRGI
jgi:hypothetical protein